MKTAALVVLAALACTGWAVPAIAQESARPGSFEEAGRMVDYWTGRLRSLGDEIAQQVQTGRAPRGPMGDPAVGGPYGHRAERPLITMMLDHRGELVLTPEQVSRLEALRTEFTRDAIRREADIRIAELDVANLLEAEPMDLAKVEAKIRELAQARADLRIARLRVIEQGKAVLTADQRTRFQSLVEAGEPRRSGGPGPRRSAATGGSRV
jgi:Spy/CpxP family protein refolding chaperone